MKSGIAINISGYCISSHVNATPRDQIDSAKHLQVDAVSNLINAETNTVTPKQDEGSVHVSLLF